MSKPTENHKNHDRTDYSLSTVDKLRKIVRKKQANRVDGVLIDLYSASLVVQVYDALNDSNKSKLAALPVRKMVNICFEVAAK